ARSAGRCLHVTQQSPDRHGGRTLVRIYSVDGSGGRQAAVVPQPSARAVYNAQTLSAVKALALLSDPAERRHCSAHHRGARNPPASHRRTYVRAEGVTPATWPQLPREVRNESKM